MERQIGNVEYSVNLNGAYNRTVLKEWNEFLSRGWVYLDMPYHFLYVYENNGIAQTWQDIYNNTPQGLSPGDVIRKDLNGDGIIDGKDKKLIRISSGIVRQPLTVLPCRLLGKDLIYPCCLMEV